MPKLDTSSLEELMKKYESKRVWENWSGTPALSSLLEASFAFIRHAQKTKDYRFLNTALKINDLLRESKEVPETELKELLQLENEALTQLEKEILK